MNSQTDHLNSALPDSTEPPRPLRWLPVRRLGSHHRERVLEHLLALDSNDRQLRFAHVASDEQIRRYTDQLDFERDEIFGVFDDQLVLVAMAHLAFDGDGSTPEFGVSVHPRLRGRGIGGRLFHHAVTHARNRGAQSIAIHIARENSAMLAIVRRAGAHVDFAGADAVAQLGLPEDTIGSQLEELVERQAADIDYRIKLQVLRLDRLFTGLLHGRRTDD